MRRRVRAAPALAARVCLLGPLAAAGLAEERFGAGSRTQGLAFGWGHSWKPLGGRAESDLAFGAFHPQMGWFLNDKFELYGEGTLFVYHDPSNEITGGVLGLAGRYHFWNDRSWTPYISGGGGLAWTSLTVPEIDRVFNFQLVLGAGVRITPEKGPGWIFEFRNHHISNAGTAGENIGVNAAAFVFGPQWVLR